MPVTYALCVAENPIAWSPLAGALRKAEATKLAGLTAATGPQMEVKNARGLKGLAARMEVPPSTPASGLACATVPYLLTSVAKRGVFTSPSRCAMLLRARSRLSANATTTRPLCVVVACMLGAKLHLQIAKKAIVVTTIPVVHNQALAEAGMTVCRPAEGIKLQGHPQEARHIDLLAVSPSIRPVEDQRVPCVRRSAQEKHLLC